MSFFSAHETAISGLLQIDRIPRVDSRGFFSRLFCSDIFSEFGWENGIEQINHTFTSQKGCVRGLHYQAIPHAEDKFVSCLQGEVFDVAVDLRQNSDTFLQWFGLTLSGENNKSILIPKGFAHGFQTLTDNCLMLYLHSSAYAANSERGIRPDDPCLGIEWPLSFAAISDRDNAHPPISLDFTGLSI
jgi:dTDP-4-dehydrorhamnose 3,5-epimerase